MSDEIGTSGFIEATGLVNEQLKSNFNEKFSELMNTSIVIGENLKRVLLTQSDLVYLIDQNFNQIKFEDFTSAQNSYHNIREKQEILDKIAIELLSNDHFDIEKLKKFMIDHTSIHNKYFSSLELLIKEDILYFSRFNPKLHDPLNIKSLNIYILLCKLAFFVPAFFLTEKILYIALTIGTCKIIDYLRCWYSFQRVSIKVLMGKKKFGVLEVIEKLIEKGFEINKKSAVSFYLIEKKLKDWVSADILIQKDETTYELK